MGFDGPAAVTGARWDDSEPERSQALAPERGPGMLGGEDVGWDGGRAQSGSAHDVCLGEDPEARTVLTIYAGRPGGGREGRLEI